jgi:hypothetical protein
MCKASLDLTRILRPTSPYQVQLLFEQLIRVVLASSISAVLVVVFLWSVADHRWLSLWACLILAISFSRILLILYYRRKTRAESDLKPWGYASLILLFFAGAVWGGLAFFYDFNWPPLQQFGVVFVLVLLAIGAIPAYATILTVYAGILVVILAPITGLLLLKGHNYHLFYGFGLVFLELSLFFIAKRYHDSVIKEFGQHLVHRQQLASELEVKEYEAEVAGEVYARIAKIKPINIEGVKGIINPIGDFSGDVIYSAVTPAGQNYILFADLSGHGLPAALCAIPISSAFYSMAEKGLPPKNIIQEINQKLHEQLSVSQFCCACFISLNPDRSKVEILNAGLPDILVVKNQGQAIERIASTHIPLGIELDNVGSQQFKTIRLIAGDFVLAYTDGFIEAQNKNQQEFGQQRLEDYIINNHQNSNLLEMLKTTLEKHSEGVAQQDDISLLEIRC